MIYLRSAGIGRVNATGGQLSLLLESSIARVRGIVYCLAGGCKQNLAVWGAGLTPG